MDKNDISLWLLQHGIVDFIINLDLTVDVNDDVDLSGMGIEELPFIFGHINGDFNISNNPLKSRNGFPFKVFGKLIC